MAGARSGGGRARGLPKAWRYSLQNDKKLLWRRYAFVAGWTALTASERWAREGGREGEGGRENSRGTSSILLPESERLEQKRLHD